MLARNSLLARLAAIAPSYAATSSVLISLNAAAVATISALPVSSALEVRFPAVISAATRAISRIGLVVRLLNTSPAPRATAKMAIPVCAKCRCMVARNCSVGRQSRSRTTCAADGAESSSESGNTSGHIPRPAERLRVVR